MFRVPALNSKRSVRLCLLGRTRRPLQTGWKPPNLVVLPGLRRRLVLAEIGRAASRHIGRRSRRQSSEQIPRNMPHLGGQSSRGNQCRVSCEKFGLRVVRMSAIVQQLDDRDTPRVSRFMRIVQGAVRPYRSGTFLPRQERTWGAPFSWRARSFDRRAVFISAPSRPSRSDPSGALSGSSARSFHRSEDALPPAFRARGATRRGAPVLREQVRSARRSSSGRS